jgi:hypothetical protein
MQASPTRPFLRDVSLREAFVNDLASYLVGLIYLFALACLLTLVVAVGWLGAPAPKESPGEIFLGFAVVSGAVLAFLRVRAHRITETLKNGEAVAAEVSRGLAYQFFVQISLSYTVAGRAVRERLWLPNTKRPRELSKAARVLLSVRPGELRGTIVRDLYER